MGKPRLIILIRHAQSEGNKNREIHQTTPDHRVKLTPEGRKQAFEAGKKLRSLLRADDTLHFYTSPYTRTRETTEGILSSLTSDSPTPSPFPRHTIKVYEEPRLREQDFGNFQPCSAEMTRMWHERAEYGHFFYRIPNGESAADAYDRVSGFNESLWRSFQEEDFASVCVLVTHGLMTRVFLMKWYHWSVEYFEDLRNINHCEFVVMAKHKDNGKYNLKNQLRTWTQYKVEREAHQAALQASPVPVRKRWGGRSESQERAHTGKAPRRQNTADLFIDDASDSMAQLEAALQRKNSTTDKTRTLHGSKSYTNQHTNEDDATWEQAQRAKSSDLPGLGSPNRLAVLKGGRDGGGSLSGNVSRANSSDEYEDDSDSHANEHDDAINVPAPQCQPSPLSQTASAQALSRARRESGLTEQEIEERQRQYKPPRSMALALNGELSVDEQGDVEETKRGKGVARADALGDQSDYEEEEERREKEAEIERETREQREFEGSIEESVR